MAAYIKSEEVNVLAERVAALLRVNETEAVRQALLHELARARPDASPRMSLVERGWDFVRKIHQSARPDLGRPAEKAFIDRLYGDN